MKVNSKTSIHEKCIDALHEFQEKYHDLVWYARSNPITDTEYWNKVPQEIREGAFSAQSRIEDDFPHEVYELNHSSDSDWKHGFNSGCLSTIRFVLTSMSDAMHEDPETKEMFCISGVETALYTFPELDT